MQILYLCKAFSTSIGLTVNAKKTLCIKFHHGHLVNEITQYTIFLSNDKLKWYSQVKHLGHTFNCCVNFSADVTYRKGQFIGCVNSIITQFGCAHPVCKLKLLVTHGYSCYGSSLWDSMIMILKRYILLGTLQYADYMICLGSPYQVFNSYCWCTSCKS